MFTLDVRAILTILAMLGAAACGQAASPEDRNTDQRAKDEGAADRKVVLSDRVILVLDSMLIADSVPELRSPYVLGTSVPILLSSEGGIPRGWKVVSEQPEILRVDRQVRIGASVLAECSALGEGAATLVVSDARGRTVHRQVLEVLQPDRAEVLAYTRLLLGSGAGGSRVEHARVLLGRTGRFLILYYRGTKRLYGNGVLGSEAPPEMATREVATATSGLHDWLILTPSTPGESAVRLLANGHPLATLAVSAVPESAIARVALAERDGAGAAEGDDRVVVARMFDAEDQEIWGGSFTWTLDGLEKEVQGDLFRYSFAPRERMVLQVRHGDRTEQRIIHARSGEVASTAFMGCSAAPGRGDAKGRALISLAMILAALCRLRRPARRACQRGLRARVDVRGRQRGLHEPARSLSGP